jgi:Protein of unknown function (DUF1566)
MNAHHRRLPVAVAFATAVLAPRTSDANAPPGHYMIGSGASAGTVYDTKSKLTWQQTAPTTTYDWADAKTYCSGLDLNGTGWRLPTLKELFSIVDRTQTLPPFIDTSAFPGTPSDRFRAATLEDTTIASIIDFSTGFVNGDDVTWAGDYVRCVR